MKKRLRDGASASASAVESVNGWDIQEEDTENTHKNYRRRKSKKIDV
jgi:hypothetical protein